MATMRAAKARKRTARAEAGLLEVEPKMQRWYPLQFGLRDKATGVVCWVDFVSIRDATRRLQVVKRFYVPGIPG